MLEQVDNLNRFSQKFRKELEEKVKSFGKVVRYKFDIANANPDPEKKEGQFLYQNIYTLDPATFTITDPYETRDNESRLKNVGIFDGYRRGEGNTGRPPGIRFRKVKVKSIHKGILKLELTKPADFETAMFLELHPKLKGGQFADETKRQVITRVDEIKLATEQRTERTARVKALNVAQNMSDKELVKFADAMGWDSTEEPEVLRNMVEAQAESNPIMFNDLVESKEIEYRSLVVQAKNKGIISFDPAEYRYIWVGNQQTITVLSPVGDKNEVEKLAEWLQVGGAKADEVYKKIKSLVGNKQPA